MGLELLVGLAVATTVASVDQQQKARSAQKQAASEQKAMNAADAMRERQRQMREERIARARIEQSSINTGVSGSSGEIGALSSLATQLSSNIGANLGKIQAANSISDFEQTAADALNRSRTYDQMGQLAGSIYTATSKPVKKTGGTSGVVG